MSPNGSQRDGFHSYLDFSVFNSSPLIKPSLTRSEVHKEHNNIQSNGDIDMGGWSFLQYFTNSSLINNNNNNKEKEEEQEEEAIESEKVYVHPLQNRSSSSCKLSTKSLEMCTESLGSETGSDCSGEIHFTPSQEKLENYERKSWVTKSRTMKRSASFPPPLTSINDVQLRPHREDGRLVLKAECVSSCHTYFQAERSGGRLRLRLLLNCSPKCNHEEEEEEEEEEDEDVDVGATDKTGKTEEEEEEKENSGVMRGEVDAKVVPLSTCKGGGEHGRKELLNWELYGVAS